MEKPHIVLSGSCPTLEGLTWETEEYFRIGRQGNVDVILPDSSVSRVQAEIRRSGKGWVVRNLANSNTNPSYINGVLLRGREVRLNLYDVLQFGRLQLKVSSLVLEQSDLVGVSDTSSDQSRTVPLQIGGIRTSHGFLRIERAAHLSWDEALQTAVASSSGGQHQGEHLLALLRIGQYWGRLPSLDDSLHAALRDAVRAVNAQRGAIVLADGNGVLQLRAALAPALPMRLSEPGYSRTLAERCFSQGQSLLCQDDSMEMVLLNSGSVRRGAMASIICALVRSPHQNLGVLHFDRGPLQEPFATPDLNLANAIAAAIATGIESAQLMERQQREFIESIMALAGAVEKRDLYAAGRTRRVADYSLLLARELGLAPEEIEQLRIGAPLLDIGKIAVDDAILRKPGRLNDQEFEIIKTHTLQGVSILQPLRSLDPILTIVRHHHERWDGNGYPDGLATEEIPNIARIAAIADAFDAMTSDRPYRLALSPDEAFAEISASAGTHFDPECVEVFLKLRPQIEMRLLRGIYRR